MERETKGFRLGAIRSDVAEEAEAEAEKGGGEMFSASFASLSLLFSVPRLESKERRVISTADCCVEWREREGEGEGEGEAAVAEDGELRPKKARSSARGRVLKLSAMARKKREREREGEREREISKEERETVITKERDTDVYRYIQRIHTERDTIERERQTVE
jgi:hypothetical protein